MFVDTHMGDLHAMAEQVIDEPSFVRFVESLAADWKDERRIEAISPTSPYGAGANGWEQGTIGEFLEAAAAWATSSRHGTRFYEPPSNPWRRCAHILLAGKIYE